MPFQAQKARISSALEQRFFTHVPKKTANWQEEQHRIDRLSRSLAAYTVVVLADVADEVGANALMDGGNDNGIDAIYYDKKNLKLIIVQSKFKGKDQGEAPDQADTLKTLSGIKKIIDKNIDSFNQEFQDKFDEIEAVLDTPGVTVHIALTCLGEELGPHATQELEKAKTEINNLTWELFTCTKLCEALDEEQNIAPVSVTLGLENCQSIQAPRKAIYGQVKANALAALVQAHGKKLFQKNIRHYLGSVAVNTSIEETVRRTPADFFYLNNGITALATNITTTLTGKTFQLDGFSIVNGAQTAGSIAGHDNILNDALVMITIIQTDPNNDDMGLRITRARNYQNTVRGIDFAGLDVTQERLRKELASIGIIYHYRPSAESKGIKTDAIKVEEAALALACRAFPFYSAQQLQQHRLQNQKKENGIDYITVAKKEIGRIWETEGALYRNLFTDGLSGVALCRSVNIFRFLDEIFSATERSSGAYARKMFFRHGRYFIIAAMAHHCPAIIKRPAQHLSEDDKTKLSQMANELAELIFTESKPLNQETGYLSIFRNLGKCQELANAVLAQFPAKNTLPSQVVVNQGNSPIVPLSATDESAIG